MNYDRFKGEVCIVSFTRFEGDSGVGLRVKFVNVYERFDWYDKLKKEK